MTEQDDKSAEEPRGIVGRCIDWFLDGIAAGVDAANHSEAAETVAAFAMRAPRSVRDSVRSLVEQVLGACEVPFMAARLYWEELARSAALVGTSGEKIFARDPAVMYTNKAVVKKGERADFSVESLASRPFRVLRQVIDEGVAAKFQILRVAVNGSSKECKVLARRGPGTYDLDLGGEVLRPGELFVVNVGNASDSDAEFYGRVEGVYLPG